MSRKGADVYGLPLLRAIWQLPQEDLTRAAILASDRRLSFDRPRDTPPNPWRYEQFAIPTHVEREGWASWESRKADPFLDAEAMRQQTFFDLSKELGVGLSSGALLGFGRRDTIAGDWITIPAEAWSLLRVNFDPAFQNWRLGHASGGGLDLWGIRILDTAGLALDHASVVYGREELASTVQRYSAQPERLSQSTQDPAPKPGSLAFRMAELQGKGAGVRDVTSPEDFEAARNDIRQAMLADLKAGDLLAVGRRADGTTTSLSRQDWKTGTPDFSLSALTTHALLFTSVLVRMPNPLGEASDTQGEVRWRPSDVEPWFLHRIAQHPGDQRWPFSADEDEAALERQFPGLGREAARNLRKLHVGGRAKKGRRPKSENTPGKYAAPISTDA